MVTALVLSGGGARTAFQVGAIEYLLNNNCNPQIILGCSAGAFNAAFIAQAKDGELSQYAEQLLKIWLSIRGNGDIYRFNLFSAIRNQTLHCPFGLKKIIRENIDVAKLIQSGRLLKISTVCIETSEIIYVTPKDGNFLRWILASASIPGVFPPVAMGERHFLDGSIRDITPLGGVFTEKPDEIIIILTKPLHKQYYSGPQNGLRVISKSFEILLNEIWYNDIQIALLMNSMKGKHKAVIKIIQPFEDLRGGLLEFNPEYIVWNIAHGFEAAKRMQELMINEYGDVYPVID